jgi:hypothetical protein
MLQVRAKPAESFIKKFRRNTCNGEISKFISRKGSKKKRREKISS